ncbi:PREDICTED: probable WRKY transcription factor 62 [Camelina sativa]|uniref:Probable WRKY transcription factor 62 n=1 Tax=Camelina sativa TaxID=90675 RepID=A0ABM0TC56_CAMSA|nr:PREDICTED: probable WRKY transcription factor 62 [Camelina sativa]
MNSCQQKAMEKLLHGRGCANQLLVMDHTESDSSMEREDLAKSVLHCFSDALSMLIDTNNHEHQDDQSNNSSPQDSSPVLESARKPLHKRGRKTSMAESSDYHRHESSTPIYHDGFLWRKYGQKQIKESDHQRSYYKCAYTKDQNCEAKKQVQKIQHNPPLYSTTYFGHHTCQLHQAYATFPTDTSDPEDHEGSHMIRFGHPNTSFSSSSSTNSLCQHQSQNQNQNQNHIKDEYMTPDKAEEWSPSKWMSSEVAHAVEAFEFNPFWTSHDLSS